MERETTEDIIRAQEAHVKDLEFKAMIGEDNDEELEKAKEYVDRLKNALESVMRL